MDNSDQPPMNRQIDDHLGVNKIGKNIKKSPLHQPNFPNTTTLAPYRPQYQPHVYNIDKNDFRNIVQQLTGSPSRDHQPRPPQNNPRPTNHRLQRVRPPPLTPTARPYVAVHPYFPVPAPVQSQPLIPHPYANNFQRPSPYYDLRSPILMLPPTPNDIWANTTESPISAYMRYLQNSIIVPGPQNPGQNPGQPFFYPNAVMSPHASPRLNGPPPLPASPHISGPQSFFPPPRMNGLPPLLPSPTSQFRLPLPTGFLNMQSPRSPYWPLISPGHLPPPPMSPNFSFSPMGQSGILGPGPYPPPSPGYGFPLSPGFFHIPSPRWRDQ